MQSKWLAGRKKNVTVRMSQSSSVGRVAVAEGKGSLGLMVLGWLMSEASAFGMGEPAAEREERAPRSRQVPGPMSPDCPRSVHAHCPVIAVQRHCSGPVLVKAGVREPPQRHQPRLIFGSGPCRHTDHRTWGETRGTLPNLTMLVHECCE